jgi:hypothetical protein
LSQSSGGQRHCSFQENVDISLCMSHFNCIFLLSPVNTYHSIRDRICSTDPTIAFLPLSTIMAPGVSYAKTTLPFPIFAAEFDPYNRGYLVVAGGGGEGRSGVPNQIVSTVSLAQSDFVNCV